MSTPDIFPDEQTAQETGVVPTMPEMHPLLAITLYSIIVAAVMEPGLSQMVGRAILDIDTNPLGLTTERVAAIYAVGDADGAEKRSSADAKALKDYLEYVIRHGEIR